MGLGGFVDDVLGLSPEIQAVAGVGALEPLRAFQDLIAGVEQVEVTNPDGTKSFVTRRLPMSPEDRARRQQLSEGITGLLNQARDLAAINVAAQDARFAPIVDAFTAEQQATLAETVANVEARQEETLAKRGLTSSTVGAQARAATAAEEAKQAVSITRGGLLLGEQLREQALSRTLSSLQPFQQQQGVDIQQEQFGRNLGQGLQTTFAGLDFARQQLNVGVNQFNAQQAFSQEESGLGTALDIGAGIFSAFGGF